MDINKIINTIREQRILKEFGLPPGAPGMGGGGGGTNALTSQAKVRSIRQMITDPNGSKLRRQQHNDPQRYLTDKEFKNRGEFPGNKERKPYKEEMSMGPTNSVGATGLQGDANPQGPLAGYDKPLGKGRKGKKYMKSNVSYKMWRRGT